MINRLQNLAFLLFLIPGIALADTLTLTDGTEYEGEIVRETEDSIIMNVQISAGLREERTFKKDDVRKVHKTTVDEATFAEKIKPLIPTGNRMTSNDYAKQIDGVVKPFLNAFPQSKHRAETEEILKTLEEEKARVDAGGIQIGGVWLDKEERDANAFDIDARILAAEMLEYAEARQFTAALRKFDELQMQYATSDYFKEALPTVKMILDGYEKVIEADLEQVEARLEQREKAFATLNPVQRKAAEEEVARRSEAYERRIDFEKKKKFRWLTLDPYHDKPMEETIRQISNLRKRLDQFDPEKIQPASELYRQAYKAASLGRRSQAEDYLRDLKRARIPEQYYTLITDRIAQAEADGVTPEEEPEAAEDGAEEGEEESGEAAESDDTAEEAAEDEEEDKSGRYDPSQDEDDDGGFSPMQLVLFGIMGIVIAIALVAVFAGKKKK